MSHTSDSEIEAAVLRRLLAHLDARKDVQNIDLMLLAGFCRNCLSTWFREESEAAGVKVSEAEARERIYGMPYKTWKERHQAPADPEKLEAMKRLKSKA